MPETLSPQKNIPEIIKKTSKAVAANLFENYLHKHNLPSTINFEELAALSTEEMCLVACANAIALLNVNYPNLFQRSIVFKCVGEQDNRFKTDPEWRWHAVAVVQTTDGSWFAFSPANIRLQGEKYESFTQAENLRDLLRKIEEKEGGSWVISDSESQKMNRTNGIPEFYELRLRLLSEMNDNDFLAAVSAYNDTVDHSRITKEQIAQTVDKVKNL